MFFYKMLWGVFYFMMNSSSRTFRNLNFRDTRDAARNRYIFFFFATPPREFVMDGAKDRCVSVGREVKDRLLFLLSSSFILSLFFLLSGTFSTLSAKAADKRGTSVLGRFVPRRLITDDDVSPTQDSIIHWFRHGLCLLGKFPVWYF